MTEISAYHEAGHAYMALRSGAKVRSITVDPDWDDGPDRHGDTQIAWPKKRLSEKELREKVILVALAGPVAEMIYTGDPYHPGLVAEWSADWQVAWAAAELLFPTEPARMDYLEQTSIRLYHLLNQNRHWEAIAMLVDHLLAHETLDAEMIDEIADEWQD
jgi:ATP-dependent Zn protease